MGHMLTGLDFVGRAGIKPQWTAEQDRRESCRELGAGWSVTCKDKNLELERQQPAEIFAAPARGELKTSLLVWVKAPAEFWWFGMLGRLVLDNPIDYTCQGSSSLARIVRADSHFLPGSFSSTLNRTCRHASAGGFFCRAIRSLGSVPKVHVNRNQIKCFLIETDIIYLLNYT